MRLEDFFLKTSVIFLQLKAQNLLSQATLNPIHLFSL